MRKADCLHSHVNMVATIKSKRFYDPVCPTLHIFLLKFPMKTLKAVDKFKRPLPSIAVISARGTVAGQTHRWHLLGLPDYQNPNSHTLLFILCSLLFFVVLVFTLQNHFYSIAWAQQKFKKSSLLDEINTNWLALKISLPFCLLARLKCLFLHTKRRHLL